MNKGSKRANKRKIVKIYIDTNVLIDYFTEQPEVVAALDYLFIVKEKEVLFTSTLALTQAICNLQTKKKTRKAFTKDEIVNILDFLWLKLSILDLSSNDIQNAKYDNGEDFEDCIHYTISKKRKCDLILTSNTSDFSKFDKIRAVKPNLALLKQMVK